MPPSWSVIRSSGALTGAEAFASFVSWMTPAIWLRLLMFSPKKITPAVRP
jgi:hypothetical protein